MSRTALKYVAEIGPELALPLARAYCTTWKIEHDPSAGEGMWWAGAFIRGALRAVLGLATLDDRTMIVSGVFTDGSEFADDARRMLLTRLSDLPCELIATLHLPTQRARRVLAKDGWRLSQGVI